MPTQLEAEGSDAAKINGRGYFDNAGSRASSGFGGDVALP
jgi:hypothetical protein